MKANRVTSSTPSRRRPPLCQALPLGLELGVLPAQPGQLGAFGGRQRRRRSTTTAAESATPPGRPRPRPVHVVRDRLERVRVAEVVGEVLPPEGQTPAAPQHGASTRRRPGDRGARLDVQKISPGVAAVAVTVDSVPEQVRSYPVRTSGATRSKVSAWATVPGAGAAEAAGAAKASPRAKAAGLGRAAAAPRHRWCLPAQPNASAAPCRAAV